jgi:hypothetical protein
MLLSTTLTLGLVGVFVVATIGQGVFGWWVVPSAAAGVAGGLGAGWMLRRFTHDV